MKTFLAHNSSDGAVAVLEVFNPIRMIIFVAHETEALVFSHFD